MNNLVESVNERDRNLVSVNKDKIRKIYEVLPKLNCGLCGYKGCGQFALAVAERKQSPFGCHQNPWAGYSISNIIGIRVPFFGREFRSYQPFFVQGSKSSLSLGQLRNEASALESRIENLLERIEGLSKK